MEQELADWHTIDWHAFVTQLQTELTWCRVEELRGCVKVYADIYYDEYVSISFVYDRGEPLIMVATRGLWGHNYHNYHGTLAMQASMMRNTAQREAAANSQWARWTTIADAAIRILGVPSLTILNGWARVEEARKATHEAYAAYTKVHAREVAAMRVLCAEGRDAVVAAARASVGWTTADSPGAEWACNKNSVVRVVCLAPAKWYGVIRNEYDNTDFGPFNTPEEVLRAIAIVIGADRTDEYALFFEAHPWLLTIGDVT